MNKQASAAEEPILRQLFAIAVQHADDGYSRCWHFGSSLVRNMVLIYSPCVINIYGSRGREFERRVDAGVKVLKSVPKGALTIRLFTHFAVECIIQPQCTASLTDRGYYDAITI